MHGDWIVTYQTAISAPQTCCMLCRRVKLLETCHPCMKNLSEEDFFLSSGCSSSQRACSGDIAAVVEWLSDMQTFEADAKFSSAVLQNRNSMVNLFRASNWVSESKDAIVSRSVTTLCWYDCSQSYRCPNQSWLLNRWTQEKVSVFTARGADTLIERGL